MGGYNGLLGYGGARAGSKEAMTDEEIFNKLIREYPGASTAALYTMMDEVKKSQNPKYTVGVDPAGGPASTAITYDKLQNAYNEMLNTGLNQAWNGTTYPTYGTVTRYYTASQEYFPPPPMPPVPQKPVKKQSQAEIAVTGKRSIILDEDI